MFTKAGPSSSLQVTLKATAKLRENIHLGISLNTLHSKLKLSKLTWKGVTNVYKLSMGPTQLRKIAITT